MSVVCLAVVALAMAACSVDQHFEFPQGPKGDKGDPGMTAYEVWLEYIQNDPDYTGGYEMGDFFLYLTGAKGDKGDPGDTPGLPDPTSYVPEIIDGYWWINGENTGIPATGKDGEDGDPGKDGVSAYEYWVTQVETGTVKDPNTGEDWPADKTDPNDFWEFLSAVDGKSAYQLWVIDVLDEDGLLNHHTEDDPNDLWPTDKILETDFWRYLRGIDGMGAYEQWVEDIKGNDVPNPYDDPNETGDEFWPEEDNSRGHYYYFLSGTDGEDGKSAYELWVLDVLDEDGLLNHHTEDPDDTWPTDKVTKDHFWEYLKGLDGKDGMGAYEQWVEDIKGNDVPNPHDNPNVTGDEFWPEEDNSRAHYYVFLSGMDGKDGKDGLSAYEIWKADVLDADGLAHPKYPNTDLTWPTSQVDQEDFWEYLKGLDGQDGQNGTVFPIMDGYYNVIVEYTKFEYGEFVNENDGSVTFTVYGKGGETLADATVSQMPGMDPDLTFISGPDGTFQVLREQLPRDVDQEYRYAQAFVHAEGQPTGELTAATTYVPERMDIRLRLRSAITLSGGTMNFPVVVERREAVGEEWELIPDYLDNRADKALKWYWVTDEDTYGVPATNPYGTSYIRDISNASASIALSRPKVNSPYFDDDWEKVSANNSSLYGWDGEGVQYFVGQLDGYYGTTAQLVQVENPGAENEKERPVVTQRVPIQRAPMIKNVSMGKKNVHDTAGYPDYTMSAKGTFDTSVVDYKYFYNTTLAEDVSDTRVWIYPTVMDRAAVDKINALQVRFQITFTNNAEVSTASSNMVTLANTNWSTSSNVFDTAQAHILVPAAGVNLFYGSTTTWMHFGTVSFEENEITKRNNGAYSMDDIPVTFDE